MEVWKPKFMSTVLPLKSCNAVFLYRLSFVIPFRRHIAAIYLVISVLRLGKYSLLSFRFTLICEGEYYYSIRTFGIREELGFEYFPQTISPFGEMSRF